VGVILIANLANDGKIDFSELVKRSFQDKAIDENGMWIYAGSQY
jgi:hypothetical protein